MALFSPFKESDAWKENTKAMELKYINHQEEFVVLHEEANATNLARASERAWLPFYLNRSHD